MYVTKNYRPTEFGVISIGMGNGGLVLPPKVDRIDMNYMCQKECTNVNDYSTFYLTITLLI